MRDARFEYTVPFYQAQTNTGETIWLPIVTVNLIQESGNRVALPLLFDTGASVTTLRHDLYPLLGLSSWDSGELQSVATAGGEQPVPAYRYRARLEFMGRVVECAVNMQRLPRHPLYMGLFGREQIFEAFGFGFWEKAHELYVTLQP